MINHELVQALYRHNINVSVCYNDNLLYRGQPNLNYFMRDGKHLSGSGKAIFARNLVHCIHNVLGGKVNGYNSKW